MKIAIIGCGRNARCHFESARVYPGARIVGAVDCDRRRALAAAGPEAPETAFASMDELLERTSVDVVHINTPPRTHVALARRALQAKCSVLIETPLALTTREAAALCEQAAQDGLLLCPVHASQYEPCMNQVRELVRQGRAGEIVNVESYCGVRADEPAFREYPAPNVLPWIYRLPGGVYQNFLAQPLAVLLPFTGRPREIAVMKTAHGALLRDMPDEIRVLIRGEAALGSLTLSFSAKPRLHFLRLYGTAMMAEADFNTMTVVTHPATGLPRPLHKIFYNLSESAHRISQTITNTADFLRGKLRPQQGLRNTIHAFYDAVEKNAAPPVTGDEAVEVVEVTEEVLRQVQAPRLSFGPILPPAASPVVQRKKVLVTGGTGFLGKNIVAALLRAGYAVRVLARKLSVIEPLKEQDVEIYFGDVADKVSLARAFEGIDFVVHAAAAAGGNAEDCETANVQGTRNVLDLCSRLRPGKLVYISTCAVYATAEYRDGQQVTETSALERFPARRNPVAASKLASESLVRWAMEQAEFPISILRQGLIYGPGSRMVPAAAACNLGNKVFILPGSADSVLSLTGVDNAALAVAAALGSDRANNQIFNVVDSRAVTRKEYAQRVIKKMFPGSVIFSCPLAIVSAVAAAGELIARLFKRSPAFSRHDLLATYRSVQIDASKIRETLGWSPAVSFEQAADQIAGTMEANRIDGGSLEADLEHPRLGTALAPDRISARKER